MLLFYKEIDKSVLTEGFSIPVSYEKRVFKELGFGLKRGESRIIRILMEGETFEAVMKNQLFDEKKYPTHEDVLQIRYTSRNPMVEKLNEIFAYTSSYIKERRLRNESTRISALPEDKKEYLAIYSTPVSGVVSFECIRNGEFREETTELAQLGEQVAEGILDGRDEKAGIVLRTRVCKVRQLSKSIAQELKIAYGCRCQICGENIGEKYGSNLIHAHHIDYFTRSHNNNAKNILILCPNHHGIIHDRNPRFDYAEKRFIYPNGYTEGLKINFHV